MGHGIDVIAYGTSKLKHWWMGQCSLVVQQLTGEKSAEAISVNRPNQRAALGKSRNTDGVPLTLSSDRAAAIFELHIAPN